ncbi:MAG: HAD family hydrolase [Desulfuromonadales bacterium]|nr:HAD family hydrolase [Desulfuromonadales bacterium]MDT8423288.1 HAD family hydrolase [Desulfuromonadales bacterium]
MLKDIHKIRSIVFDLDGTLYVHDELAADTYECGVLLVARERGIAVGEARELVKNAERGLIENLEITPSLTRICFELGIEATEFHRYLKTQIRPEQYLDYDPVLVALLDSLHDQCQLYLYTNNNLALTGQILTLLGVADLFQRLYTIEFTWRPKPDAEALEFVMCDIGGPPESFLFVGDRYDIDLRLPDARGCSTLQISEVADLLQIHKLMHIIP